MFMYLYDFEKNPKLSLFLYTFVAILISQRLRVTGSQKKYHKSEQQNNSPLCYGNLNPSNTLISNIHDLLRSSPYISPMYLPHGCVQETIQQYIFQLFNPVYEFSHVQAVSHSDIYDLPMKDAVQYCSVGTEPIGF